jgi:hypothetical protein
MAGMGGGGMGGMEEMMAGISQELGSMNMPWNAVLNTRLFPDGLNLNWTRSVNPQRWSPSRTDTA